MNLRHGLALFLAVAFFSRAEDSPPKPASHSVKEIEGWTVQVDDLAAEWERNQFGSAGATVAWGSALRNQARKPGGSNFDWAGPLAEAVLLGNVALRLQLREELTMRKLLWDGPNMQFTNCEDANKFLKREYRTGMGLVE